MFLPRKKSIPSCDVMPDIKGILWNLPSCIRSSGFPVRNTSSPSWAPFSRVGAKNNMLLAFSWKCGRMFNEFGVTLNGSVSWYQGDRRVCVVIIGRDHCAVTSPWKWKTEQGGSSRNTSDLYSWGSHFESRPTYWLSWWFCVSTSAAPCKYTKITLNQITTNSFHIFSTHCHKIIRHYSMSHWYRR